MWSSTLLTLASLLVTQSLAVPLNAQRDIIYVTATTEVLETIWTTTTVWEDEVTPTAAVNAVAAFYESYVRSQVTSTSISPASSTSSSLVSPVPVPSTTSFPPETRSSPLLTSTLAPSVRPTVVASEAAGIPVAAVAAPPVPAPISSLANSIPASPAPQIGIVAAAASASYPYTGDITFYDVSVGLGSCGVQGTNSQDLVALPAGVMANGANPNANPKCGKMIEISYGGNTHKATVYDTCPSCSGGSIDLTEELFKKVAPNGDGRVGGVSWRFVS